ncbi:MAG: hypothetical protein QF704_03480 [Anaerolineales bacterium]|jgi:hypothetical protein|nr:hypothetical protein [Anaerolineales bacterium]
MSNIIVNTLIIVHAVAAIFMAWPFYALILTGERSKLEPPFNIADDLQENIIRTQSYRCLVYQISLLISGIIIIILKTDGELLQTLQTNLRMLAKMLLIMLLVGMNIYMVFYLQERIDKNIHLLPKNPSVAPLIAKYRGRRRWMAAVCLWYVLMAVILGVQAWVSFGQNFIIVSAVIAALFVLRAYQRLSPFGWL